MKLTAHRVVPERGEPRHLRRAARGHTSSDLLPRRGAAAALRVRSRHPRQLALRRRGAGFVRCEYGGPEPCVFEGAIEANEDFAGCVRREDGGQVGLGDVTEAPDAARPVGVAVQLRARSPVGDCA